MTSEIQIVVLTMVTFTYMKNLIVVMSFVVMNNNNTCDLRSFTYLYMQTFDDMIKIKIKIDM